MISLFTSLATAAPTPDTSANPSGLTEGQSVRCKTDGVDFNSVFRYTNGKLSGYSDSKIAKAWASDYSTNYVTPDCSSYTFSTNMPQKPEDGTTIQCAAGGTPDALFRFTGNILRGYPNPDVAKSWKAGKSKTIDCTNIFIGTNMSIQ